MERQSQIWSNNLQVLLPHLKFHDKIKIKQPDAKQEEQKLLDELTLEEQPYYQLFRKKETKRLVVSQKNLQIFQSGIKDISKWTNITSLILDNCNQILILNSLIQTKFSVLKVLSIGGNQIESIQALTRVNIPLLHRFQFHDNKITSISSLRKCAFAVLHEQKQITKLEGQEDIKQEEKKIQQGLKSLIFTNNNILEGFCLCECQSPALQWISIDSDFQNLTKQMINLHWTLKLQAKNPRLSIRTKRLKIFKLLEFLKKKHHSP